MVVVRVSQKEGILISFKAQPFYHSGRQVVGIYAIGIYQQAFYLTVYRADCIYDAIIIRIRHAFKSVKFINLKIFGTQS